MSNFQQDIDNVANLRGQYGSAWDGINPEYAARMKAQNRFQTGIDIAKYTAAIMRQDMPHTTPIVASTRSLWVAGTVLSASRSLFPLRSTSTVLTDVICTCRVG
jgi:isocitrate lyase